MKAREAVRDILEKKGSSSGRLAAQMGLKQRVITDRLSQDNISIDKLNEMLRILEYKIVLVPAGERRKEDWYVLGEESK